MKRKIFILIALLLVSGVCYAAFNVYQLLNPETLFETRPTNEENKDRTDQMQNDVAVSVPAEQTEEEYRFDENRVNILLLGLDADEQRYETMKAFRTDTIILLSVDFKSNQLYLISIPRDSYVKIPGRKQRDRINTAFVWGGGFKGKGFEKTIETVSSFLGGIPIHYYAGVDMNVFKEIVDIMGGVEFEVDVSVRIEGRELKSGLQRLNGQQVLDYCRNRHFPKGDIERVSNQQKMLLAIFNELKSSKQLLNVSKYYQILKDKIYTNLNAKQIAALGVYGMKLEISSIHTYSIPGDFLNIDGISYWGVNQYGKKELVKEIFGIEIKIDPKDDVKYIKKELEEQLKALASAINQANDIIDKAQKLTSAYSDYIHEEEKAGVKLRIDKIHQSIDEEDTETIKNATGELKEYMDQLEQILKQRKKEDEERKAYEQALDKARKEAQQVIQWVNAQVSEKGDKISPEGRQEIETAIAKLNEVLNSSNVQEIVKRTAELKKQAEAILNAADQSTGGSVPNENSPPQGNSGDNGQLPLDGNNSQGLDDGQQN